MKINIFENTLRVTPFDENEPSIEITDEQYNQIINGDLIARNGKLIQNIAKALRPRITELKEWFNTYYTIHEQKYRRLIDMNIDKEQNEQLLQALYIKAEQKRAEIQQLEEELMEDK